MSGRSAQRNTFTGKTYNSLDNISQFFGERGMPFNAGRRPPPPKPARRRRDARRPCRARRCRQAAARRAAAAAQGRARRA